ncbi:hypothetical protein ACWCQW_37345 [Streptomyces mirabilis]
MLWTQYASTHLRVSVQNQDTGAGTTHFQLVFQNNGTPASTVTLIPNAHT